LNETHTGVYDILKYVHEKIYSVWLCHYREKLLYRMSQEEGSVFWEVIVSVILNKKVYTYMCPIPNSFQDRAISLYSSKIVWWERDITYCFWYWYLFFKWQSWYSLPSIIHFWKFQSQQQCTLQLVWEHGILLIWVHLDIPALWKSQR
jgi:hypothetical protein